MFNGMKHWVRTAAAARGIELRKVPRCLLGKWEARLAVDLEMVLAAHAKGRADITFVQIGAYDGVAGDALHKLIGPQWRGVFVEPQPAAFAQLTQRYAGDPRFTLANVAIGERDETRELFTIDTTGADLPSWAGQVASFRRDVVESQAAHIPDVRSRIRVLTVECVTFDTLVKRFAMPSVDLLQLDTEGYDGVIVRSIDLSRAGPAIIRYEHKHLNDDEQCRTIEKLIDAGYRIAPEYEDTIAYRKRDEPIKS